MNLTELIKDVPDFPKPGVLFKDISPLLKQPDALHFICEALVQHIDLATIDYFVGIESRGFVLAAMLAAFHHKGFVPLRKAGKLPPPIISEAYSLEYGTAELEISPGTGRVMIIDDVLATGGTLQAGINLTQKAGYSVEDVAVLINLTFLNTLTFKQREVFSLVRY